MRIQSDADEIQFAFSALEGRRRQIAFELWRPRERIRPLFGGGVTCPIPRSSDQATKSG